MAGGAAFVALASCGLVVAAGADDAGRTTDASMRPIASISVLERPKAQATFIRMGDVKQLTAVTDVIVSAEVVSVEKGPARFFDLGKRSGETAPPLPSMDVRLRVLEHLRGAIEDDPVWSFTLAPGGAEVEGDPLPVVGERYVLFLRPHDAFEDRWVVPTLDGRLRLDGSGRPRALLPGGVGRQLEDGGLTAIRRLGE